MPGCLENVLKRLICNLARRIHTHGELSKIWWAS